jgi:hypothetical protein
MGGKMKRMSLLTLLRRKLSDRTGQSTTEYILILAIVVMIASKVKKQLGANLSNQVNSLDGKMSEIMQEE